MRNQILWLSAAVFVAAPAAAQENWVGAPSTPTALTNSEFIEARCNVRGPFVCPNNPDANPTFVPLTAFARSSTVEALGQSLIAVTQSVNSQASAISALQAASTFQQGQFDALFDLRAIDRRDARQGIATALAMGSAPMPSAPGRTSYVLNVATFRGEQAIGGSLMHRLNTSDPIALTVGISYAGNRNNGARVGVAGEF